MKRKVNCGQLSVETTLLGLLHIVKDTSEAWLNTRVSPFKRKLFSAERVDVMLNKNFALSSNSRD